MKQQIVDWIKTRIANGFDFSRVYFPKAEMLNELNLTDDKATHREFEQAWVDVFGTKKFAAQKKKK
jgi:hypothetical protein